MPFPRTSTGTGGRAPREWTGSGSRIRSLTKAANVKGFADRVRRGARRSPPGRPAGLTGGGGRHSLSPLPSNAPRMRRLTIATALFLDIGPGRRAATLPSGFSETFVSGFSSPTAMAIAPDGRLFVCEQGGDLRVIKNGVLARDAVRFDHRGRFLRARPPRRRFRSQLRDEQVRLRLLHGARESRRTIASAVSRPNGDVAVPGSELPLLDLE